MNEVIPITENPSILKQNTKRRIRLIGLPGTGKTTRLLQYLDGILEKYPPDKIIYCSFSNAAVNEATDRVFAKFGLESNTLPYFRTMHSLCLRLLKQRGYRIGSKPAKPKDFILVLHQHISEWEEFADFLQEMEIKASTTMNLSQEELENPISLSSMINNKGKYFLNVFQYMYVNYGCTPTDYEEFEEFEISFLRKLGIPVKYLDLFYDHIVMIEKSWSDYKRQKGLFEFGELLGQVLRDRLVPEAKILIVDEYQDSSSMQAQLIEMWSGHMEQTMVAGDPNQAIYGFQGSSPQYLENFANDETILLDKSWRLPPDIIEYCQDILWNEWTEKMHAGSKNKGSVFQATWEDIRWRDYNSVFVLGRTGKILETARKELIKEGIVISDNVPKAFHDLADLYNDLRDGGRIDIELLYKIMDQESEFRHKTFLPKDMFHVLRQARQNGVSKMITTETVLEMLNMETLEDLRFVILRYSPQKIRPLLLKYLDNESQHVDLNKVKFMTMHASKGMEAEMVILLTTGSYYETIDQVDEDEEERLYFVAATRTKGDLALIDLQQSWMGRTRFLPELE